MAFLKCCTRLSKHSWWMLLSGWHVCCNLHREATWSQSKANICYRTP